MNALSKLIILALTLIGPAAEASTFEWGAGVLTLPGNHYRGSDQTKIWVIPTPYIIYKSDRIEAEGSSVNGSIYKNGILKFNLSLMAGLNVESDENDARTDMPPIDYTFEIGPMAIVKLWESRSKKTRLNFEFPVRLVSATDFSYIDRVGIYATSYLNLINDATAENGMLETQFSIGPMFGDRDYHNYFYEVEEKYERSDRPAYRSHGGYSGFQTNLVFNKRWKDFVFIPFIRWDYLQGAAFENSPLVKRKNYFIGGVGVFWLFGALFN